MSFTSPSVYISLCNMNLLSAWPGRRRPWGRASLQLVVLPTLTARRSHVFALFRINLTHFVSDISGAGLMSWNAHKRNRRGSKQRGGVHITFPAFGIKMSEATLVGKAIFCKGILCCKAETLLTLTPLGLAWARRWNLHACKSHQSVTRDVLSEPR